MKNVLIACEESQTVCKSFRNLGFNAYSCDILPCSGGHPEWHLNCDVIGVIQNKRGILETGEEFILDGEWDLMIAHPPCTYLSVSGARWYYHPDDEVFITRSTVASRETIEIDGKTYPLVKLEITSSSHPFFTGK